MFGGEPGGHGWLGPVRFTTCLDAERGNADNLARHMSINGELKWAEPRTMTEVTA